MKSPLRYGAADSARIWCALLVVAIHTSPLLALGELANFLLVGVVARLAVPFFFCCTGFFTLSRCTGQWSGDRRVLGRFLRKTLLYYAVSAVIYLPVMVYSGSFPPQTPIQDILFNGTFYHLWYFPALLLGVPLTYLLRFRLPKGFAWPSAGLLYAIGLLGDSYYGLTAMFPSLSAVYDFLFRLFDYTRNGLFFAPVFLLLGLRLSPFRRRKRRFYLCGLAAGAAALFTEALLLYCKGQMRHDSMYISLIPCLYFLFSLLLSIPKSENPLLRKAGLYLYVIHPFCIVLVRMAAKFTHMEALLVQNHLLHFVLVALLATVLSFAFAFLWDSRRLKAANGRCQINPGALRHNVAVVRGLIPKSTGIIAVVKDDAYGHGSVRMARLLRRQGVKHFAVATLEEGVRLRKAGIFGEILILGFTAPRDLWKVQWLGLTQTVLDEAYGRLLHSLGRRLKVHIKIDTGMRRSGVPFDRTDDVTALYRMRNLRVTGIFSHFSVSDSLAEEDAAFTRLQAARFEALLKELRDAGISTGKIHLQSSYGICNYPDIACDYVRPGLALYGALDTEKSPLADQFRPVMSLTSTIALVRRVEKGDCVGYGRDMPLPRDSRVGLVPIGYGDGVPRTLGGERYVLVRGCKAEVLGLVCMDQMLIDLTDIPGGKAGDTVTLIGKDGEQCITPASFAAQYGTIPNEILSRMGPRLIRN